MRLHAIPQTECPFDAGASVRLAQARERIAAGLVDTNDFDAERQGWSARQVREAMIALLPLPFDRVVTPWRLLAHNLLVENRADTGWIVTGCIDVGRAGLADRYQDICGTALANSGPGCSTGTAAMS